MTAMDVAYYWKQKTENTITKQFLNVWIVPRDPVLSYLSYVINWNFIIFIKIK